MRSVLLSACCLTAIIAAAPASAQDQGTVNAGTTTKAAPAGSGPGTGSTSGSTGLMPGVLGGSTARTAPAAGPSPSSAPATAGTGASGATAAPSR
jgi:hypothetical protein